MADLNELLVFVKVVEAGSFTGASRRLGMPKTTVSRKIAELESRLGARLVHRTTRRTHLTEAGEAYHKRCAHLIAEIEEAELAVSALQQEPHGVLRLSAPVSLGSAVVADWVFEFVQDHRRVNVQVMLGNQYVDLVAEGIDLAFRVGPLRDSSVVARALGPVDYVVCASPGYLAAHDEPRTPQDLDRHDCIRVSVQPGGDKWAFAGPAGAIEVDVKGRIAVNDLALVRIAAMSGVGVAYLPNFMVAADLQAGRLVRVMAAWSPPSRTLYAVYPSQRFLSPKVRAFLDFVIAKVMPSPPWAV